MRTMFWTLVLFGMLTVPARAQSVEEIPLGSSMPASSTSLATVTGGDATLSALAGNAATVVLFWSNQCPWVDKYESRFVSLAEEFGGRGVRFVLVNSNDPNAYPREAAEESARLASRYAEAVTYIDDGDSELARSFGAQRTPHVFLFDANRTLVYVGTIDDSPGDPGNVESSFLRDALSSIVNGGGVSVPKTKAFGCTIKFRS